MEENNKINMPTLAAAIAYTNSHGGGGGGGTSNYNDLSNKPQIGGTTLTGNKSASDLGLVAAVEGKGLSTNDYTDADKAIVGGVTAALAGKQDALTAGKYIDIDENNEISVDPVVPNEAFTYTIKQIDDYSLEIIKTVNDAVVFDEVYSCYDPVAQQQIDVNETFDDAINIHNYPAGERSYTLLIASDAHEAGFKQTTPWWQRNTFVENFSTVDHSGEKLVIKSELDTAINAIKDGQSIDSFSDVETALADKQDKTDNNLTTTDKTTTGAINELKSGLTNLSTSYVNMHNGYYRVNVTGDGEDKWYKIAEYTATTWNVNVSIIAIASGAIKRLTLRYDQTEATFNNSLTKIESVYGSVGRLAYKYSENKVEVFWKAQRYGINTYTVLSESGNTAVRFQSPLLTEYVDSDMDYIEPST